MCRIASALFILRETPFVLRKCSHNMLHSNYFCYTSWVRWHTIHRKIQLHTTVELAQHDTAGSIGQPQGKTVND